MFAGSITSTWLSCDTAFAGRLLDYIRDYDLNNYALGLSLSGSQSPYLNADSATIAYPFLTSFRDSAFTNDWLFFRDGDMGIRWANDSGWEIGAVGRIQTLGTGTYDDSELVGLEDRKWTLELGPTIGWRRWPIHAQFKTYAEVGNRHEGITSHLVLSWPFESDRGYLVPAIDAIYRSSDYDDYYFGVSQAEATPTRLEYHPGSTTSTELKVRWGYALTDKWLLSGDVGIEFLDDAIATSPIVGRNEIWSARLALAYNANIFQPRASQRTGARQPRVEIRAGAFSDSIESKIVHDSSAGNPGSEVDLEQVLGLEDSANVAQIDAIFRMGNHHRIEVGYFEISRSGLSTLGEPLEFGTETFAATTEVASSFETKLLRLGYAYSLINDDQKELGVMAGVHYAQFKTFVEAPDTGQREFSNTATPLPVIGAHATIALGKRTSLGARVQAFRMHFDHYEGTLNYATLDLQRRFGDRLSIGLGYNYYDLKLESRENGSAGRLEVLHQGPVLFAAMNF